MITYKKYSSVSTVNNMLTAPVGNLIIKLSIPTIVSMMITALYNMADTFFVSKLGTSASGAVGIIFSIMAIIQAVGFTLGMGSGSILSRKIGGGDLEEANEYSSTGIIFAFLLGTILAIVGIIFQDKIINSLGATETILPYAKDYAHYIFIGAPFMITSFVLNNQLRFQGKATLSMLGLTTGGILNIILDPIFIFIFNMGIKGAAIATLISQIISFSILMSFFLLKRTETVFSIKKLSKRIKVYTEILKQGFPSLCRQGLASISTIFLNISAAKYGSLAFTSAISANQSADAAVAGMSITSRMFMFIMSFALGLGQGFQPVCAMNYGAKKYDRVKESFLFLLKTISLSMLFCMVLVLIFAPQIVKAFRNDIEVIQVGSVAMRFQAFAIPFHSLIFSVNMLLQTTGKAKSASFLSSLRQGLYFIPLIWILPLYFGLIGVQISQGIADILTALTTIPFAIYFFKEINNKSLETK